MLYLLLFSFIVSFGIAGVIIRQLAHYAHNYSDDMPQRFHAGHVPRFGGIAIFGSIIASWLLFSIIKYPQQFVNTGMALKMIAVCTPVFLAGSIDDFTQRFGVRWRLLSGFVSAIVAYLLFDITIPRIGAAWIDSFWMAAPWLGFIIAGLGLTGFPHAFNMIDGYNGLAGTIALMIYGALFYVAFQTGDREMAAILVCLIGATLGFLLWNYPRGMIFAGDGGAYFWGVSICMVGLLMLMRNKEISPLFMGLLLMYPMCEALFSIYRKLARGQSPGTADSLHFHQLIYRRVVRSVFNDRGTRKILSRNNRTSPYLWVFASISVVPAVLFWDNTAILMFFCALSAAAYVAAYLSIVRFKLPEWLRKR